MAKRHKTDRPPPGALEPLRNRRLYGGREVQIEGVALRAKGCPDTRRTYAGTRPRRELRVARESAAHVARLQSAQVRMLHAQRAVRDAKRMGWDYTALAAVARGARAEYLRLTGGLDRHAVSVDLGSDANRVKAAV